MKEPGQQAELSGLVTPYREQPFRLRVNDIVRIDGKLCRVIHVSDCAAVVLMNRPPREFKTRFDRIVWFQPGPLLFRISPNSEVEVLNRTLRKPAKQKGKK
jgi:hypothetical protein